ncbi:hypothetical protein BST36_25555 [Mycolicibacterium moriokaense]|jgi:hypothetical protein|uniref:Uncharacterized protein n=1 Tax=Mycolicibacterium moriokaense TaxID=39691 RepID=A0AAD1M9G4_9MYCO|nr:DUF5994 family protein [Mycolicibacterium moriokaense]MCV7042858.1 hypothetical protein [Mycolicibacterium moriokaense]ORB16706.1 hypothetical protein BST36_25555 [Mycolicibacterium moriokaense]BBX04591.1 hypothetical protein MMOR_55270 [Mycolicibacterium moriokaense]
MTRNQPSTTDAPRTTPDQTPRLRLKPKACMSGYVDGAWWPHSDDLTTQLPDLLAVLSVRLGPIGRVVYNANEWDTPPRKVTIGGRTVRLGGFQYQPVHTLEVLGLSGNRIALLVVPPNTDPEEAHTALMAAAGPGNDSTVADLLASTARVGT